MFTKKIPIVFCAVIMFAASLSIFGATRPAYAAAPAGCYLRETTGEVQAVTCPASLGANPALCYVAMLLNPGVGTYNQTDCASITVTATPPTTAPSTIYVRNDCNGPAIKAGEAVGSENHCGILDYLLQFINFLSALVGIVVVGSIIWGGIQYSSASGDPQKVSAAKGRIFNAVIALFAYMFIFAFLQYIVPGGIF